MNRGDKVFCVARYNFKSGEYESLTYKVGKWYEVFKYDSLDDTVYISEKSDSNDMVGLWFSLKGARGRIRYFSDYFITLAEWRQQQIDKILEDD